jgi:hypothetical protein
MTEQPPCRRAVRSGCGSETQAVTALAARKALESSGHRHVDISALPIDRHVALDAGHRSQPPRCRHVPSLRRRLGIVVTDESEKTVRNSGGLQIARRSHAPARSLRLEAIE